MNKINNLVRPVLMKIILSRAGGGERLKAQLESTCSLCTKPWDWSPEPQEFRFQALYTRHADNPTTQKVETGRSDIYSHPWLLIYSVRPVYTTRDIVTKQNKNKQPKKNCTHSYKSNPVILSGQSWWCTKSGKKKKRHHPRLKCNMRESVRIESEINYPSDKENNFQSILPWQTHVTSSSERCALICNSWCGLSSYQGWKRAQSVYA